MHSLNKELGYELEEGFRRVGNKPMDGDPYEELL